MPATANPVAAYDASVMCSVCWNAIGFIMPAMGSMLVIWPSTRSNPAGEFIHVLAYSGDSRSYPSVADGFYTLFYLVLYAGSGELMRGRAPFLRTTSNSPWDSGSRWTTLSRLTIADR